MKKETRQYARGILAALAAIVTVVIIFGAVLWLIAWEKLPYVAPPAAVELAAPILNDAEYDALIDSHARPFIFEISTPTGAVLIYGSEHTKDPNDPQLADIEKRWQTFRPTIALCESDLGILFPGLMDPVREFGEAGALNALARRDGVRSFTWEPQRDVLVRHLLTRHSKDRVAARFILGPYFSNLRHGRPLDPDAFVEEFRAKRTRWSGLENSFSTVAEIDSFWRREFPAGPDWRDVTDEHGLPGFLSEMELNPLRDEHFAKIVVDFVRSGERVFAVCGSSHAVKIESALRATCGHN